MRHRRNAKVLAFAAVGDLGHQRLWQFGEGAQRDIRRRPTHPQQPVHQQRAPQAELASNRQHGPQTGRHRHLMASTLPELHQPRRVAQELLAGRSQHRPGLVPNEERSPQLLLQGPNARADGCLAHMEALGGTNEVPGGDDGEEGAGQFDVHGRYPDVQRSKFPALKA